MRYAIWAAVSTDAQAAIDKVSLDEQEQQARQAARAKDWRETAGPFVVRGESRTRYVNLRDAEMAIPELHQMLEFAQRRMFDILVLYDFSRLRDLLDPVARTLAAYGVQLYSVSQPVEPQPAQDYNQYATDTADIMQGMSLIISRAQLADLRRKYQYAMPRRASERGLPVQIPFGYRKPPGRETDRKVAAIQVPAEVALIQQGKDLFIAGQSLARIADEFRQSGLPPPAGDHWWPQTVRWILANPYYAGYVRWGATLSKLDPRTGKKRRIRKVPADKMIIAPGKHEPIWDEDTHRAIMAEFNRRGINHKGRTTFPLTGILACGICEKTLWTFYHGNYGDPEYPPTHVWRCSSRLRHIIVKNDEILRIVGNELVAAIRRLPETPALPEVVNDPDFGAQLAELELRRKRLEAGYLAGAFSLEAMMEQSVEMDHQIDRVRAQAAVVMDAEGERRTRQAALSGLATLLGGSPDYLEQGDPQEVNRMLHLLIRRVLVRESGEVRVEFK